MLVNNTPVETYQIHGQNVFVKREDLCCTDGPPFSKVRGIIEHLRKLKLQGINTVGYTETAISMAGWGVAWVCDKLDMKAVIFDPQYKQRPENLDWPLELHRDKWHHYEAILIPIEAGRAKVNWYISRKLLKQKFGSGSVMLPLGLPFEETILATEAEVARTLHNLPNINTFVINVGSGTICAGLWRGVTKQGNPASIYGIMGRTGNIAHKMKVIETKAHLNSVGLYKSSIGLFLKDPGWQYTEASTAECPFPCNKFYDLKAWEWLTLNINTLKKPILFWNIGS